MTKTILLCAAVLLSLLLTANSACAADSYKYFRTGNKEDVQTKPTAGIAMMGGGSDLDEAFRWLCNKGNGGDFLILRATGDDDYSPYVKGLCKANSVATLIIPNQHAAMDPAVAEIISKAEVVFIAGGDQSNYVRGWQGTPVEKAINENIAAGKPIGGTSAGLAVQGEFVYGCMKDKPDDKDLASTDVLRNPYFERVTLVRDFLKIPHLENLITDSHFAKRDRLGRSLGFLARLMKDGWSSSPREVAIDEKSAVLVEADGKGHGGRHGQGRIFHEAHAGARGLRERRAADIPQYQRVSGEGGRAFRFDLLDRRGRDNVFVVGGAGENCEHGGGEEELLSDERKRDFPPRFAVFAAEHSDPVNRSLEISVIRFVLDIMRKRSGHPPDLSCLNFPDSFVA